MSAFTDAKDKMEDLLDQKESLLKTTGDVVTRALIAMNNNGSSSANSVKKDIDKLLSGWSIEEKYEILLCATSKAVVNL